MNQAEFIAALKVRDARGVPLWVRKHDEVIRDGERAYAEYAEAHLSVTYERPTVTGDAPTTLDELLATDPDARACLGFFNGSAARTLDTFRRCYGRSDESEPAKDMDELYRVFASDLPITFAHECACGTDDSHADDDEANLYAQWEAVCR